MCHILCIQVFNARILIIRCHSYALCHNSFRSEVFSDSTEIVSFIAKYDYVDNCSSPLCFIAQSSRSRGVSKFLQIQRCNFSHSPINENSKPLRTVTSSSLRDGSTKFFDFTVIGSGVAGLRYALEVAKHGSVAVITKAEPHESNTNYAQGGVSAVLCPSDSVESHVQDTIVAGAYLCDEETVRVCYKTSLFIDYQL